MIMWYIVEAWLGLGLLAYLVSLQMIALQVWQLPRGLRHHRTSDLWLVVPVLGFFCLALAPITVAIIVHLVCTGEVFRTLVNRPPYFRAPPPFTRQAWLAPASAGDLLYRLGGTASRQVHALVACACCRLIWNRLTDPRCRRVVEAAESALGVPDGVVKAQEEIRVVLAEVEAGWSWRAVYRVRACEECLTGRSEQVAYYVEVLEPRLADTLVAVVRCVVGDPFVRLRPRPFPAEVVELARACDAGEPLHGVLADALDELGEDAAAAHCRTPVHVKGCHVVDWVLGRR
ncbi:MAG: hypothetical protein U0736_14900 [Gemmataceae bacterium]